MNRMTKGGIQGCPDCARAVRRSSHNHNHNRNPLLPAVPLRTPPSFLSKADPLRPCVGFPLRSFVFFRGQPVSLFVLAVLGHQGTDVIVTDALNPEHFVAVRCRLLHSIAVSNTSSCTSKKSIFAKRTQLKFTQHATNKRFASNRSLSKRTQSNP